MNNELANDTNRSCTVSGCGSNAPSPEADDSLHFGPEVMALVAIGAAIAANCEPCLRYHVNKAKEHGVSALDINRAVEVAIQVKETPHRNIQKLATQLTQRMSIGASVASNQTPCCKG